MSFDKNSNVYVQPTFDIYVNSLPKDIKEDDLKQLFLQYGEIAGVLCRHKAGEYGYAIVKFKYKHDAEKFLEERNKVSINGHYMEVKSAKRNFNYEKEHKGNKTKPSSFSKMNLVTNEIPRNYGNSYHPKDSSFHHGSYMGKQNGPAVPGMIEVLCTYVENAITFYGCPVFRYLELRNLSAQLNDICLSLPRLTKRPAMNKIYAAVFLKDMSWYRCKVLHRCIPFKPGMCTVYYIDYGNQEDVLVQNMVELPEAMRSIPPFTEKYVFTNLECNLHPKLHSEVTYLHHLVNHRMSLCAYLSGNHEYQVSRCICNGIDVISEIVKKGFGSHKAQISCRSAPLSPLKVGKPKDKTNKKNSRTVENAELYNGAQKLATAEMTKHKTSLNFENSSIHEKDNLQKINGCISSAVKNQKSSSDELRKENDFVPKKIIKRGCELELMECSPRHEENAEKPYLVKVDTVLANLKLINNIRDLVSLSDDDDDIINDAANIFFREIDAVFPTESTDPVEDAIKEYMGILTEIKNCCDKSELSHLKSKRDLAQEFLMSKLDECLDNFDMSIFERKKDIQKIIIDLESNSNAWMNIYLDNPPSAVETLLIEYKKVKEMKKDFIKNARGKTNEKHQMFLEFLSAFQKEFCLNLLQEDKETSNGVFDLCCKKVSWSVKFEETLSELGKALELEIKACTLSRGSSSSSIVQCILDKLDIPKEKIDAVCGIYNKYSSLRKEISSLTNFKAALKMLGTLEEKIENLNMQLLHFQTSKKFDIEDLLLQLHHVLLEKDMLMETVAKAFELHSPELSIEYPDLMLKEYCSSKYLLKHGWKSDFFPYDQKCSRIEPAWLSKFLGEPAVVKEYVLNNDIYKKHFLQKIIAWNNIKSEFLVKVKAVFHKDENTLCILTNPAWNSVSEMPCTPFPADKENTVHMLQQVLLGLKDLHSRQLVHGAIHPLTVLYEKESVLLDFCFCPIDSLTSVKGICFQPPSNTQICESADMYGFGCLVLWALFPNLSFGTTAEGVPNLPSFRSIVEELLSSKDYTLLSALVNANEEARPSCAMLLNNGFLKGYGSCHQSCK